MSRWEQSDFKQWSSCFDDCGDFIVVDPARQERWVHLDHDLRLLDQRGDVAEAVLKGLEDCESSPYPQGSLSDRFFRLQAVASRLGLEASWGDDPWGFAGTYLSDALDHLKQYRKEERKRDSLREELSVAMKDDELEGSAKANAFFAQSLASNKARKTATACLAALQATLDAAFFELCDMLQVPTELADWMARASFDRKWPLLAAEARVLLPQSNSSVALCKDMLQRRNELIHTPPRLKRKTTPDTWFSDLVPSSEELELWARAVGHLLADYSEALGCNLEIPDVSNWLR